MQHTTPRFAYRLAGLAAAALLLTAAAPATAAAQTICDGSAALTLIGIDTTSGSTLFAVPPIGDKGTAWIVELDGEGREARVYPDTPKGRFGGSVGPGPVLAGTPCGDGCLQPVRWSAGTWTPLGEALTVPRASTVTPTYDAAGVPWFVVHGGATQTGEVKAWAFRLEGREWEPRGSANVAAVGQPQALPSPQRKDGVISGTGLFSASGRPGTWVTGLPGVTAERRGQVLPLAGTSAAYVSGDGVVYLTDDSGKAWRRSTWTPWGTQQGTTGMWRQGSDYWVDLPFGDHRGALRLVWYDRRRAEEVVVLTRLTPSGAWARLAEVPSDVRTKSGEKLAVTQVLVPQGDVWILLSGCAATAEGSGLVLRTFDGTTLSPARFVALKPGGKKR